MLLEGLLRRLPADRRLVGDLAAAVGTLGDLAAAVGTLGGDLDDPKLEVVAQRALDHLVDARLLRPLRIRPLRIRTRETHTRGENGKHLSNELFLVKKYDLPGAKVN